MKLTLWTYEGPTHVGAYLGVFESLFKPLHAMAAEGYALTPSDSVEDLREMVLKGNAARYGQPTNVAAIVPAADIVAKTRHPARPVGPLLRPRPRRRPDPRAGDPAHGPQHPRL